jgi:hypothetical protein
VNRIILFFSGLILIGIVIAIQQFTFLHDTYERQISIYKDNLENLENKIDRIVQLNIQLSSIQQTIENQSATFNQALGKIAPLIIPDIYKVKLERFKSECDLSSSPESFEKISALESEYNDYITTTPPWIQEGQLSELLQIRYSIQFFKAKVMYENEMLSPEETETILTRLNEERPSSADKELFKKPDQFLELVRMEIINSENLVRKDEVDNLLLKASEAMDSRDSIDPSELEDLIGEFEEYRDEFPEIQSVNSKLENRLHEMQIQNSVEQMKEKFEVVRSSFETKSWNDSFAHNLFEDLEVLKESSSDANILYNELKQLILRRHYMNSLNEMYAKFQNARNLSDDLALQVLPIMKAEMASLMLEIKSAESEYVNEQKEAGNLINEIGNRLTEIEKAVLASREKALSSYNNWALGVIEISREKLLSAKDRKGVFGGKELYRKELIALFDNLLLVESNLLFEPVRNVYHEVYAEMMSDLEPENKLEVAQKALTVEKKTIDAFIAVKKPFLAERDAN